MKEILLLGGGGHCKSVIDVIEQEGKYTIIGILDNDLSKKGTNILGYEIIGTDKDINTYRCEYAFVTVGQLYSSVTRYILQSRIIMYGFILPTIISPRAYVSKHASIGRGTVIMHDTVVNAGASIGNNCIINTKALIEHDAVIEDNCHISTSAIVNGGVTIGNGTFYGSNATSKQMCKVSQNNFIKAGSVVV